MAIEVSSPSLVRITREPPPTRVHVAVTTPTGRHYRWARDEPRGENVPSGLRWSTTAPGGFETADAVLPRSPRRDYDDLKPLSDLRVLGAGGRVAGEYRLEGKPVTSGDQMAVSPSAVGWQANLSDNGTASLLIIDRDLSKWIDTTSQRKEGLTQGGFAPGQGSFSVDPGVPATLKLQITSINQTAPPNTGKPTAIAEAYYDAGPGCTIGEIRSDYTTFNIGAGWTIRLYLFNTVSGFDAGTLLGTSGTFTYDRTTSDSHWRGAMVQLYYGASFTGDGEWDAIFSNMRVIGAHGLPIVGASPAVEGVYASDAVKYIVKTFAPMLQCDDSTIQHSTYIIPQLAFAGVDPGQMVNETIRFGIPVPDWFVWEDRTFYLHDQGTRNRRWRARIGPTQLSATGPDLSKQFNSVMVSYTDVDGTTKVVGPPGSGADYENARLVDRDPANPLNQVKDFNGNAIVRRAPLSLGTSESSIAIDVGAEFLDKANGISLAGQAQHVGWIEDFDTGVLHPYWAARAGDVISYSDASDTSFRRVSRTDNSDDSKTNGVSLDAPADTLAGLLERLGAEIIPVGLG